MNELLYHASSDFIESAVKFQKKFNEGKIKQGDVFMVNSPRAGGS